MYYSHVGNYKIENCIYFINYFDFSNLVFYKGSNMTPYMKNPEALCSTNFCIWDAQKYYFYRILKFKLFALGQFSSRNSNLCLYFWNDQLFDYNSPHFKYRSRMDRFSGKVLKLEHISTQKNYFIGNSDGENLARHYQTFGSFWAIYPQIGHFGHFCPPRYGGGDWAQSVKLCLCVILILSWVVRDARSVHFRSVCGS